jgi:hypothetical protein
MSDINIKTHLKRMTVYLEGRKAFEDSKQRGFNPYIRSNPEFALHWWNGWDTAKKENMVARLDRKKS